MALDLPIDSPLTDSQGELTAKIGSMKSLLALPSIRKRNIPKGNQISTFDYLLKILDAMGLSPEVVFNAFLTKVFDQAGTFLEERVLNAIGDSIGEKGIKISPYTVIVNPSDNEKKACKTANKAYLASIIPATFLQAVKQDIAKQLMIMIFGRNPTLEASAGISALAAQTLIENTVCAEGTFSMSSDPMVRNQDIEYNKIKLREQLSAGTVVYEISCQNVKITLPPDPTFIFTGGGMFSPPPTTTVTPAQSLQFTVQYVNNQVQRINNETNANKGGKKFLQILIEKLIALISAIIQPYLPNVYATINSTAGLSGSQQLSASDFAFSNCDIANNPTDSVKKEFSRSLFNALLKDLLKLLLLFAIKKFKQMVANYFARTALEKQRRKLEKAKMKFQIFSKIADNADKIQKYQAAISTLSSVLGSIS